ncbi:MAG: hypothetical protein JWQ12_1751 [Glaciihabitans sp.]|nr:hypothetical protein [Glaciihabitans sp.]
MEREELQAKIDELMRQYDNEEIDAATYSQAMMELTASRKNEIAFADTDRDLMASPRSVIHG